MLRKKQFRVLVTVTLLALFAFGLVLAVQAFEPIKVYVNGKALVSDTSAQIINNRTFLPLRAVAEALGAEVTWNESERAVYVTPKVTTSAAPAPTKNEIKFMKVNGETTTWPYWVIDDDLYMEYHNALELLRMEYNPIFEPITYSVANKILFIGNRTQVLNWETKDNYKLVPMDELKRVNIIDYTWNADTGELVVKPFK